jgi:hypothetical protein
MLYIYKMIVIVIVMIVIMMICWMFFLAEIGLNVNLMLKMRLQKGSEVFIMPFFIQLRDTYYFFLTHFDSN